MMKNVENCDKKEGLIVERIALEEFDRDGSEHIFSDSSMRQKEMLLNMARRKAVDKNRAKFPYRFKVGIAAAICLVVLSAGSVYAFNLFGVKDYLTKGTIELPVSTDEIEKQLTEGKDVGETPIQDINVEIWTSHPKDSNEAKATVEWLDFLNNYDKDNVISDKIGNSRTEFQELYGGTYFLYTQEMVDKLEEIAMKYDLKLYQNPQMFDSEEELCALIHRSPFLKGDRNIHSGYAYEDGLFKLEGEIFRGEKPSIEFGMVNTKNGYLTGIAKYIADDDIYTERSYQTSDGRAVNIVTFSGKSVIIQVPLSDSTVEIFVLLEKILKRGWEDYLTEEQKEAIESGEMVSMPLSEFGDGDLENIPEDTVYYYTDEDINELIEAIDFSELDTPE